MNQIEDVYGLTPAQEGMYYQYFNNNHTDAYHLYDLFQLDVAADIDLLNKAVKLLPLRHPVLKTAFSVVGGSVKQVILSDRQPVVITVNLEVPFSETELEKVINSEESFQFDLQKDTLFRCTFIQFVDRKYVFLHTHHLITDGWSMSLLFSDLMRYYNLLTENTDVESVQDLIENERKSQTSFASYVNYVHTLNTADTRNYWENLLFDYSVSALPKTEGLKKAEIVFKQFTLPYKLSEKVVAFSRMMNVSLSSVFEFAFSLSLQKYTGSKDVVFNKVISGKSLNLSDIGKTFGPMINTVPIRAKRNKSTTPAEYLDLINNQSINANEFGYLSLSDVYRDSGIDPHAIDVFFAFENYGFSGSESGIIHHVFHCENTEFPFTVQLIPDNNDYSLKYYIDTNCYNFELISGIHNCFLNSLSVLVSSDKSSLNNVDLFEKMLELDFDEKQRVLYDFNHTFATYDNDKSIYDLFLIKKNENCNKGYISSCGNVIGFSKLDCDASAVDTNIRLILGNEKQIVGVICDRSYQEIAAIFGIVRGGNAYMPISPEYPPDRIKSLIDNSGCKLVIVQKKYEHLADCTKCIEDLLILSESVSVLSPAADPCDTLYVINTSGSTGVPKGAAVSNRSAVNRIQWMADRYFDSDTVVMHKTPYTFDVSVWEIFGFAVCGFSLYILPADSHYNQIEVLNHIEKGRITDLHFVPSVFRQFLSAIDQVSDAKQKISSVKNLFFSGESLSANDINTFFLYHEGSISVHNLYGPAECAVDVTSYDCLEIETDPIPIGKPIYNTQIYILDDYLNPVPVCVKGELCIAGDCVGYGYINLSDLTEQKFVDNPFGDGKLYRTGDIAYWREDGNIVFVGRNDFQVKINGQRVELGEIKMSLLSVDSIDDAEVILFINATGRQVLCAYYTGREIPSGDIRVKLSRFLPAYMIPQIFVHLDSMPLSSSGKIDRGYLISMANSLNGDVVCSETPRNDIEEVICRLFENVLNVNNVGRNDNFYNLGGGSIDVIRLLSSSILSSMRPSEFMENPTPASLALKLTDRKSGRNKILEPLYIPEDFSEAVVLFSFAGGDASAYAALVSEFRKHNSDVALFYVHWMNEDEYILAADEIKLLAGDVKVYFYSHCAGAVTALKLLDLINSNNQIIHSLFAGGIVLPTFGEKPVRIWKHMSNNLVFRFLKNAGLPFDSISDNQKIKIVNNFRLNTDQFFDYVQMKSKPTDVNVELIISRNDLFTRNYKSAEDKWSPYVSKVSSVCLIDSKTHYFQSEEAVFLYEYIVSKLKEG